MPLPARDCGGVGLFEESRTVLSFHRLAVRVGVSRETGQDALATADKMPALQFETND